MWPFALLAFLTSQLPADPAISVRVDSARHEVVVSAGHFVVGGGGGHHEHGGHVPLLLPFRWPVGGWVRGASIEVNDEHGQALSRHLIHHLNVVNLERRQLVRPAYERLLAVGQETGDLMLPAGVGVPVADQSRLALLVAWDHAAPTDLGPVDLTIRFRWVPPGTSPAPLAVLPLPLDVGFVSAARSDAYDLPPGPSDRSFEFRLAGSGRILAIGGHLHDHGVSLRLEDVTTGKVLVDLQPIRNPDGQITGMPTRVPGAAGDGILLKAGRPYRLVARYDNPTGETLADGAMGVMIGIFAIDAPNRWSLSSAGALDLTEDARALAALKVIGDLAFGSVSAQR